MADQNEANAENGSAAGAGKGAVFITRVILKNYKSIAHCDVPLGPLTFLVGRNGSGKSNFLDALRFVSDALRSSLDAAIDNRGGIADLRHRGAAPEGQIAIHLDFRLPDKRAGSYSFSITLQPYGGYTIADEKCNVEHPSTGRAATGFQIHSGRLLPIGEARTATDALAEPDDRLYLASSPIPDARLVYEMLAGMAFYRPVPDAMRPPHAHDPGNRLLADGSNCASVLLRLAREQRSAVARIAEYLRAIVPGFRDVQAREVAGYDVLLFTQRDSMATQKAPFTALSMSDGTLYALAVLTALFQAGFAKARSVTLIGIEESEADLHPYATAPMRDALRDASAVTQVLATSQSPDLLNDRDIAADAVRVVWAERGVTTIGPLDAASQRILQEQLFTVGQLTRRVELKPAPVSATTGSASQCHY